nr:protease complex subunit PrcB family protein [uncultured Undibacterium sp.]
MRLNLTNTLTAPLLISTVILSACGGGDNKTEKDIVKNPAPIVTSDFINLAKDASCANIKNRLFVIDQKQVFWDKAGSCADAAYSQTLYGATPQTILCSNADSIAGPRLTCSDTSSESLFKTMLRNLDKADLGLGSQHQVQQIVVPGGASVAIPVSALMAPFYRGVAPTNIVIKDLPAWNKFWELSGVKAPTMFGGTDFQSRMTLGTFFKTSNNCSITQILKVSSNGQKLTADYVEEERIAIASCDPESKTASTPMNMVELAKIDLPVEFNNVSAARISHKVIDQGANSGVTSKRNVVVKDQAGWMGLWQEHNKSNASLPNVDFSKSMIVGLFMGSRPTGCYAIEDVTVWRAAGKTQLTHRDRNPGPTTPCILILSTPYLLIEIPRSDEAVEFQSISVYL